jgi:hypothetical protein
MVGVPCGSEWPSVGVAVERGEKRPWVGPEAHVPDGHPAAKDDPRVSSPPASATTTMTPCTTSESA